MGFYCTLHIEQKINNDWYHYNRNIILQDYALYERMGMHTSIGYFQQPKGLPQDITYETEFDYQYVKADSFDMSWLSSAEVIDMTDMITKQLKLNFNEVFGYFYGETLQSFALNEQLIKMGLQDFRFIYWFK